MLGVSFRILYACLIVYGRKLALIAFGHFLSPWIIWVVVRSQRSLMCYSQIPFSWCAFTPANVKCCCYSSHWFTHLCALKIPLSPWYASMIIPLIFEYSFKSFLSQYCLFCWITFLDIYVSHSWKLVNKYSCTGIYLYFEPMCHLCN